MSIGSAILYKNWRNIIHVSFFIFVLGMSAWMIGVVLILSTGDFIFDKLALTGGFIMVLGMTMFSYVFPHRTTFPSQLAYICLPLIIVAAGIPFNIYIVGLSDGAIQEPILGPLFPLYATTAAAYMFLSVFFILRNYRRASHKQRMQIAYLASGIAFLMTIALISDLILPMLHIYQFNLLGPAATLVFVVMTATAMVRHQLLDIRIVIQRSLIYSILLGGIIALYIGLLQILRYAFGPYDETVTFLTTVGTTIVGIFSAPHIERFFRKITDRIFFKDTYNYADALRTLSEVLHANVSFADLVRESEDALQTIFKNESTHITLSLHDEHEHVLSIPLTLDTNRIGSIHLGAKRSGDPYTPQDIHLLETFAYQAATALSRAQLYADAQDQAAVLERKVEERTHELSQTRIREQHMLNDLSHNLQTPLTILQTRLETLKRIVPDNRDIESFEQSLAGFSGFIYDLLALARLEGGRTPEYRAVSITDLLNDLTEEIEVIASVDDISVETDITPGLVVRGDERRLREALLNIASNALKYMPPDSPREKKITFSAILDTESVIVRIHDTGAGIHAEDMPRVFDRFYRGKDIPSDQKGTGLGLSITKQIIEQHRGTITLESVRDAGTTIEIRLPLLT